MKSLRNLQADLPASFVVFLVALPLSLGIALASGAPAKAGLIAAVVGGITVGLLGGAPLQVSGPAAGLTVMVFGFVQRFGFRSTCAITLVAGLLQLVLGAAGAAQLALAISPAVLHAMLAGIGILIALAQVHVILGGAPQSSAVKNLLELPASLHNAVPGAITTGLITLGCLVLWNRFLAKRIRVIPGALVAITTGTLVSWVVPGSIPRVAIDPQLLSFPEMPAFPTTGAADFLFAAFALMIVASAESLLCAVATDRLHGGPRANLNRELMGQGAGNALSGLLGGLPITGVIVRSSANISAGAVSQLSAIFHAVWLLVFAFFFSAVLSQIPLAALAALLIHIGFNLVKIHEIKKLSEFNEALVYFATLGCVVLINLLWGIGIGIAISLIMLLYRISQVRLVTEDSDQSVHAILQGSLSFLSVPRLSAALRELPPGKTIELELQVDLIDHAAIEAIRSWKEGYERTGGKVLKAPLNVLWEKQRGRGGT